METSLVFTVIGPDRPGLVELWSKTVAEHGGNWLESRMASLSGQFAGVARVSVPDSRAEPLKAALLGLETQGLRVMVEGATEAPPRASYRKLKLELVGQDRPGIVREVSSVLRKRGVNISELVTNFESAAMSGEALFKATTELELPQGLATSQLREDLEALANDIMVDIELEESGGETRQR